MRIVLTGGGTAGSVSPLLAILEELRSREPSLECLFIGTRRGNPETQMVAPYAVTWASITSGKLRRYWSPATFLAPFAVAVGFFQALLLLIRFRPDCIVAAGGYVGVPCVWAGWVLGIRIVLHQPDMRVGLATILTYRMAHEITTGFSETASRFPGKKARWTGIPVRQSLVHHASVTPILPIPTDKPLVLFVGGGTGSATLNRQALEVFPHVAQKAHMLLVTGAGKQVAAMPGTMIVREHLGASEMAEALSRAAIIVTRAGANAIAEATAFQKPLILVPLPHSPQVDHAQFMRDKGAAMVYSENDPVSLLVQMISQLIDDRRLREGMVRAAHQLIRTDAARTIANIIFSLVNR